MSIKNPLGAQPRPGNEFATLGGGCFWCLEAVYEELQGVVDVESGYAGGRVANPTYRQVCDGDTGHAEVVRIEFDPARISYREILEVFFSIHDPTTRDRQGNDVGTQYRSVIFHHSDEQQRVAEEVMREAQSQIDAGGMPSIGWQLLAYLLITSAEVLVSITCLEFSYTQAPRRLKSFVMSLYFLSITAGNLLTSAVNSFIQNADGTNRIKGGQVQIN